MKTIKLIMLSLVAMLFATSGCIEDYTIHENEIAALKSKKIKPILPVSYVITGDMEGTGLADNITLTLGEAFGDYAGPHTGRVTIGNFSYGREKGIRLNFIITNETVESYAITVEHYEKGAAFGIFYPGDPWRMQTASAPLPDKGFLTEGITVIQQ
ncbi:hypothetical protein N9164_00355 [Draconibacterium sp.]|nr:hypothetical protein [Draconibacterium sp.]